MASSSSSRSKRRQRQFALPLLPCGRQGGEATAQLAHLFRLIQIGLARTFQTAKGVEQLELVGRLQERFALALAVDVHQQPADLFERGHGGRLIVDVGVASTGPRQPPRQDDFIFFERRVQDRLDLAAQFRRLQLETARDAQLVGPGAEQVG